MNNNISSIFLLVLLWTTCGICQKIDLNDLPEVPDYVFTQSNPGADTVIIALHGGPSSDIFLGTFLQLEQVSGFSVVEMLKSEMMTDVLRRDSLTFEECIAVNDTTAALIQKTVEFYKGQGKYVALVGHSWGAIIMGEYLDDYGSGHVDKLVPMEGRLNAPLDFVEWLKQGILPLFDGLEVTVDTTVAYPLPNVLLLGAAAFENRWIDSLATEDLTNLMYTHSEWDMNTGRLLPEEVDFLEDAGANVLMIDGGTHGSIFQYDYMTQVIDFIRESDVVSDVDDLLVASVSAYPLPARDFLNVDVEQNGNLIITDMQGSIWMKKRIAAGRHSLDVGDARSGSHVMVFQPDAGKPITKRIQLVD